MRNTKISYKIKSVSGFSVFQNISSYLLFGVRVYGALVVLELTM